jgi:uncharacterized membrane protein YtjA (UPF0391 family)
VAIRFNPITILQLHYERKNTMLYWAAVFFVIAIVAGLFGFGAIASASAGIAQILFFIFAVLFMLTLLMRLIPRQD